MLHITGWFIGVRTDSASLSFIRWPRASLSSVPPKRLPRRAVRGLGAHSPHQTGPFSPTDFFIEPEKLLVIELKAGPELLEPLVRVLDASCIAFSQVRLITFSFKLATLAKHRFPQVKVLWLYGNPDNLCGEAWKTRVNELILKSKEAGLDGLDFWAHPDLDREVVKRIHAAGLELLVWTVNDPAHGLRLREAGVNGITTDVPDRLKIEKGV